MLNLCETLPDEWLELPADRLHEVLDGPALVYMQGRRDPALFISVLMHGNEPVGWDAVRRVLKRYRQKQLELPRSIHLFIGNVQAAQHELRHLFDQPDFNRIWPGTEQEDLPEARMMQQVVERVVNRGVFASVDIHNNTGLNPHYACVNRIAAEDLYLASLFGRTIVYFLRPLGVQSLAMSAHCPAVTLECGKSGEIVGVDHAERFIDACLHLAELPDHPPQKSDMQLFHTTAIIKVPQELSFSFSAEEVELRFAPEIDHMNFRELPSGTEFGEVHTRVNPPLLVTDERGQAVFDDYFEVTENKLLTRVPLMPSMLTLNHTNIRQDCLCYLMERYRMTHSRILSRNGERD